MNCERIGEHVADRLQGTLDERTSLELERHLAGCPACREEIAGLDRMWSLLGEVGEERAGEEMRSRFYAMLAGEEARARGTKSWFGWIEGIWPANPLPQGAMLLATLILGLLLGMRMDGDESSEVRRLREDVQSMSQVVSRSLLQHPSASERLRAVSLSRQVRRDAEVTRALLDTINKDSNVNVRLAALDVLSAMLNRPEVRNGLLEAMPQQNSPMMQVAMADVLSVMDGPQSRSVIEKTLERPEMLEPVREHLRQALLSGGSKI